MNKHLGLQYVGSGLGPPVNLQKLQPALYLSTSVPRVHAPAHAPSRPRLQMV